ncbi:hypothetical protein Pint_22159 [Pistacia integerrima]|uniref:Uncharacterized protein n=1 Tax=Pistacia integerrima TaxID=434235 RepID=A0ACC0YL48_9ROSI|nr:hypothetical protein Pint_22159 [Pistacia integerrima]
MAKQCLFPISAQSISTQN